MKDGASLYTILKTSHAMSFDRLIRRELSHDHVTRNDDK